MKASLAWYYSRKLTAIKDTQKIRPLDLHDIVEFKCSCHIGLKFIDESILVFNTIARNMKPYDNDSYVSLNIKE